MTTTATLPKIESWTILYHDHEFTDFILKDHSVPPCTQTTWQLKIVLSPGNVPFRLYIELDGQVVYDHQEPEGLPDPLVTYFPVQRSGPHDISAGLHIEFAGKRDIRYVHFACQAA